MAVRPDLTCYSAATGRRREGAGMAERMEWLGSLDAALEVARRARKIVLVDYVKPG